MPFIASVILLASASTAATSDGPLTPASRGLVQCYEPNEVEKTCRSIATYQDQGDGSFANTAIIIPAPSQPITLETTTSVWIKNGAVCGFIHKDELLKGKLLVSGKPVANDLANPFLAMLAASWAPMLDKETCTTYVPGEHGLIAKATITGINIPIPDQRVKWIRPDEGYIVAEGAKPEAIAP